MQFVAFHRAISSKQFLWVKIKKRKKMMLFVKSIRKCLALSETTAIFAL